MSKYRSYILEYLGFKQTGELLHKETQINTPLFKKVDNKYRIDTHSKRLILTNRINVRVNVDSLNPSTTVINVYYFDVTTKIVLIINDSKSPLLLKQQLHSKLSDLVKEYILSRNLEEEFYNKQLNAKINLP